MTRSELPTEGFQGLVFRVGVDEGAVKSREKSDFGDHGFKRVDQGLGFRV